MRRAEGEAKEGREKEVSTPHVSVDFFRGTLCQEVTIGCHLDALVISQALFLNAGSFRVPGDRNASLASLDRTYTTMLFENSSVKLYPSSFRRLLNGFRIGRICALFWGRTYAVAWIGWLLKEGQFRYRQPTGEALTTISATSLSFMKGSTGMHILSCDFARFEGEMVSITRHKYQYCTNMSLFLAIE